MRSRTVIFSLIVHAAIAATLLGAAGKKALRKATSVAFTDDGLPVTSPGLMRRALQYGRRIAVHCEEPTLARNGQMHEGPVSAELGFTGYPSVAESVTSKGCEDISRSVSPAVTVSRRLAVAEPRAVVTVSVTG